MQARSCFYSILVFLLTFSTSPTWAKPKAGDRFGDWTLQCAQKEDQEKENCHINQNLTYKKDGKQLLNAAVGHLAGSDKEVLIVTLRLGIFLPVGVQIGIDKAQAKRYPFQWCLANGCHAYIQFTPELLKAFKRGNICNITFQDAKRTGITIPVSLKGFTKAYFSMQQL